MSQVCLTKSEYHPRRACNLLAPHRCILYYRRNMHTCDDRSQIDYWEVHSSESPESPCLPNSDDQHAQGNPLKQKRTSQLSLIRQHDESFQRYDIHHIRVCEIGPQSSANIKLFVFPPLATQHQIRLIESLVACHRLSKAYYLKGYFLLCCALNLLPFQRY